MIRSLLVLLSLLVIVHAGLSLVRVSAVDSLSQSYGLIGIDGDGRVRHWAFNRDEQVPGEVVFLSGDEVSGSGSVGSSYDEFRQSEIPAVVLGARIPDRRTGGLGRRSIRKVTTEQGRTTVTLGDWRHMMSLTIGTDGSVGLEYLSYDRVAKKSKSWTAADVHVVDQGWDRTVYLAGHDEHSIAFIFDSHYWVVSHQCEVLVHQPVDVDMRFVLSANSGRSSVRSFSFLGGSVRPDRVPIRMLLLQPDKPVISRTVILEPVTRAQKRAESVLWTVASLRPALFNLVASALPEPTDPSTLRGNWWIDPYLAGGANGSALLAGIGLAVLSAWFAFRSVRVRLERRAFQVFWIAAVFLLGPLGLLWMRLSVPWHAIENGRAVNLGEWPEPERNGTEVFA
jgi:hypothetical protein